MSKAVTDSVIFAAAENKSDKHHRDWLFRTSAPHVWAQYAEEWAQEGVDAWHLKQFGLQLYIVDGPLPDQRNELFALHCEPQEPGDTLLSKCKKGPHVHITAGDNLLSRTHVPLCYANIDEVVASMESLTATVEMALDLVDGEVLPRIE